MSEELAETRLARDEARDDASRAREDRAKQVAAGDAVQDQMLALAAASQKKVNYIEELDERLGEEQELNARQAATIASLQATLTDRTVKEAASSARAAEAEKNLEKLKLEARALRVTARSVNMRKAVAATQTEGHLPGPELSYAAAVPRMCARSCVCVCTTLSALVACV